MQAYELFKKAGIDIGQNSDIGKKLRDIVLSGITTDSRRVRKNCLFICIKGLSDDGHSYIRNAAEAGAAVIVAESVRGVYVGGAATVTVNNTRQAASLLYSAWYDHPASHMKIVGITGTNGKTSTAYILREIFENEGRRCGMIGTLGCFSVGRIKISDHEMTTPSPEKLYKTLNRMRRDGAKYVFMEVSSHSLVQERVAAIGFYAAIFTNLSEDHLDFHGDMESYFRAKARLFDRCKKAIINIDDPAGERLRDILQEKGIPLLTCSRRIGDIFASDEELYEDGCEYSLVCGGQRHRAELSAAGDFQITNSLCAIAFAHSEGIKTKKILRTLASIRTIPGRMERVVLHEKQQISVIIDYAHTPDALEKLLLSVRKAKRDEGRIVLLFGCGGERERQKRRLMGLIASRLSDMLIITSDNSRGEDAMAIIDDILKGIDKEKEYVVIPDRREAILRAVDTYTRSTDTLILAGKGHECYSIDTTGKHPFDERKILREAFEHLYG